MQFSFLHFTYAQVYLDVKLGEFYYTNLEKCSWKSGIYFLESTRLHFSEVYLVLK